MEKTDIEIDPPMFSAPDTLERHETVRWVARVVSVGLISLAGCMVAASGSEPQPGIPQGEQVAASFTSDELITATTTEAIAVSTITPRASTTTTEAPATTSTIVEASELTGPHAEVDNGCDDGITLDVVMQGPEFTQVSVDYINEADQKINQHGEVIPDYQGYSAFYYSKDGAVCFENIPANTTVYIEVYSLDKVETPNGPRLVSTEQKNGHAMSGRVYPGQTIYFDMPRTCSAGGNAGSISVNSHSQGVPFASHRLAAWSSSVIPANTTRGFGAENEIFEQKPGVRTLNALASDQAYLLHAQSRDANGVDNVAVVEDVPVNPCEDTEVDIDMNVADQSCIARIGARVLKCFLNKRFIG